MAPTLHARQKVGIVLLVVSVVAALALVKLDPLPVTYEQWQRGEAEGTVLMLARGPAISRYDPGTDTTVAVFRCDHGYCSVATQIAGNATAAVAASQVVLFAADGAPEPGDVDLAQPIAVPETSEAAKNVTAMTGERFEIGSAWLPLLMYQLVFLAAIVSALLLFRASDVSVMVGALGVGAGMFVGAQFAAFGPDRTIGALLLMVAVTVAGIVLWRIFPRARWSRLAAIAAIAFAAAMLFSEIVTIRYFAHAPMM